MNQSDLEGPYGNGKGTRAWPGTFVARGALCLGVLCLAYWIASVVFIGRGVRISEDRVGHAVSRENFVGWVRYGRKILFAPPGWQSGSAEWQEGVSLAFHRVFGTNDFILVEHDGRRSLLKLRSVTARAIECDIWKDERSGWQRAETSVSDIRLENSFKLQWSFRELNKAFLYSAPFVEPEVNATAFRVAVMRDQQTAELALASGKTSWARFPWEMPAE